MRALRHGMVGQPGWELFGPWDDEPAVHEALLQAGEEYGMRQVGGRAYSSNTLESGWIPSPLPAVYTGDSLKAYREWLPAEGYEGRASIGGSFESADIEDYYFTPWDLGYGSYVKFDHDFIGRDALEAMADGEHRQKVTLALDHDDVTATIGTMFDKGDRAKFVDWPSAVYCMHPFDRVTVDGETIGLSTWIGYSRTRARCSPSRCSSRPRRARDRSDAASGASPTAGRRSRPSSRTCRPRSRRRSPRSRT